MRITRLLPFALLCMAGCGKGPAFVGKWTTTMPGGTTNIEFTSNTFKQTSDFAGMHMESSGTYVSDTTKITMTITDIKMPEQFKALAKPEDIAKAKATPYVVDFKLEEEKLTLTPTGGPAAMGPVTGGTFTRVK